MEAQPWIERYAGLCVLSPFVRDTLSDIVTPSAAETLSARTSTPTARSRPSAGATPRRSEGRRPPFSLSPLACRTHMSLYLPLSCSGDLYVGRSGSHPVPLLLPPPARACLVGRDGRVTRAKAVKKQRTPTSPHLDRDALLRCGAKTSMRAGTRWRRARRECSPGDEGSAG